MNDVQYGPAGRYARQVVRWVESGARYATRSCRGVGVSELYGRRNSITKVRVTLVIELRRPYSSDTPTPLQDRVAYLAPDSTHRTTCLAYLPAGPYWTSFILGKLEARYEGFAVAGFAQWLEAGLGPCAFYAAYGTPGRSVE